MLMPNTSKNNEKGVGLIEIMVSLFLIVVAVLGYALLQNRTLLAMDESGKRSTALFILEGLANQARANIIANPTVSRNTIITNYTNALSAANQTTTSQCNGKIGAAAPSQGCNSANLATSDVAAALKNAANYGITIKSSTCPSYSGTAQRSCLYALWDDTVDITNSNNDRTACLNTTTKAFNPDSNCTMIEAF